MRTGLTKQEKTTDIWFDEKDPLIHIRTHNTDLKKRLAAYAGQYPDQCCQTDADPETGCITFSRVSWMRRSVSSMDEVIFPEISSSRERASLI